VRFDGTCGPPPPWALFHGIAASKYPDLLLAATADSGWWGCSTPARPRTCYCDHREDPPSFKLSLAIQHLRLVNQIAGRGGRHLELAVVSRDWLGEAAYSGAGDLDYSAVIATNPADGE
jgi:3-hydroxyisobutyrate dehydrogenase-like beta-hydroxyacid dehydrogenase